MKFFILIVISFSFSISTLNAQNLEWAEKISTRGFDIKVDSKNNIVIGGIFAGTQDFDPSTSVANLTGEGNYDIFIAKYDTNGNYLWAFPIGGVNYEMLGGITVDKFDNIYVTGYFKDTVDFDPSGSTSILTSTLSQWSYFTKDAFIAKYNKDGQYQWVVKIGGDRDDSGSSITSDNVGNVYTTGIFSRTVNFDPINNIPGSTLSTFGGGFDFTSDVYIAKYNPLGELIWANNIGNYNNDLSYFIETDDNYIYMTGKFIGVVDFNPGLVIDTLSSTLNNNGSYKQNDFVTKFDVNGNYVWARKIDVYGSIGTNRLLLTIDDNENIYIANGFEDSVVVNGLNTTTTLYPEDSINQNSSDVYFLKYNSNGQIIWANTILGYSEIDLLKRNNLGVIYIVGNLRDTTDFDPSISVFNAIPSGMYDTYIASYDSNGVFLNVNQIGNNTNTHPFVMEVDYSNNIILNGAIDDTTDFDFGPNITLLTATYPTSEFFLVKYSNLLTNIDVFTTSQISNIKLFPNPTNKNIKVILNASHKKIHVSLKTLTGVELNNYNFNNTKEFSLNLEHLPPGIYFLSHDIDGEQEVLKIVKY